MHTENVILKAKSNGVSRAPRSLSQAARSSVFSVSVTFLPTEKASAAALMFLRCSERLIVECLSVEVYEVW